MLQSSPACWINAGERHPKFEKAETIEKILSCTNNYGCEFDISFSSSKSIFLPKDIHAFFFIRIHFIRMSMMKMAKKLRIS